MNQILSFQTSENGRKVIKKNVRIFAIFTIIFALILAGEGAWKLYKNKTKKSNIDAPDLNIIKEDDKTVLNISSVSGIQKIIYVWDDMDENTEDEENIVNKNGEKNLLYEIPTSLGTNNLIIKLVESNGNTTTYDPIKIVYDGNGQGNNEENWEKAV